MLLFGTLFSLFSNPNSQRSIFTESYFWHGLVFTTIFNVAVVYAIIHYPDWMWMYFVENSSNTLVEILYIFAFIYYLPYVLGYYIGRDLKKKSWVLTLGCCVLLAAVEGWIIVHLFERYSMIGTKEEFLNGKAISLFSPDNPIGAVMNGSVAIMVVYFFVVLFLYKKRNRASPS